MAAITCNSALSADWENVFLQYNRAGEREDRERERRRRQSRSETLWIRLVSFHHCLFDTQTHHDTTLTSVHSPSTLRQPETQPELAEMNRNCLCIPPLCGHPGELQAPLLYVNVYRISCSQQESQGLTRESQCTILWAVIHRSICLEFAKVIVVISKVLEILHKSKEGRFFHYCLSISPMGVFTYMASSRQLLTSDET